MFSHTVANLRKNNPVTMLVSLSISTVNSQTHVVVAVVAVAQHLLSVAQSSLERRAEAFHHTAVDPALAGRV